MPIVCMYDQFKLRAESVSAEVCRFATGEEALAHLGVFLRKEGLADQQQATALWAPGRFRDSLDRRRFNEFAGLNLEVTMALAAEARVGISEMDWALADTGSVVQDSSAIEQRLVSTLPAIHVALVPTAALLPDLAMLLARVNPRISPYLSLITGPSRTADIERVLTIGVHGPKRLVVMFIDDLKALR